MTKTACTRDNVLDEHERATSARKCVNLLGDVDPNRFKPNEWGFFCGQLSASKLTDYAPSERQLAWLRDMVEKYAL